MKLELKHICGYLPYGLMILRPNGVTVLKCTGLLHDSYIFNEWSFGDFRVSINKMVLRPLSDLTKEITHKGETFVPMLEMVKITSSSLSHLSKEGLEKAAEKLRNDIISKRLPKVYFDALEEWMFDVNGLIKKDLAIDVNTLEDNPYE